MLILKKILIVLVICLSMPLNIGCSEEPEELQPIEKLTGEEYWSIFANQGGMRNVREDENGQVTGEMISMHGYVPFIATKSEIEKPGVRIAGYIRLCETLAAGIDRKHNLEGKNSFRSKLKRLTGVEFESREEFKKWLKANRKNLRFSEKLNRLEVIKKDTNK